MGAARRVISSFRGWEYWNTYIFEFPLYLIGLWKLWRCDLGIRDLCKANWALDHGGFSFASKYKIQHLFDQSYFPQTICIDSKDSRDKIFERIAAFQVKLPTPYPLILKPDNGRIGKGVVRAQNDDQLKRIVTAIEGSYLVQEYCALPFEAGIFIYRRHGKVNILSINTKEFPQVTGDGLQTVRELVKKDIRLARFTKALSEQVNNDFVPQSGENILLSYVGNHAQGCVFRSLALPDPGPVIDTVDNILSPCDGFNYGRLDVRSASQEDFIAGNFIVLEVNGIDSLSTNIFDPSWSIVDAYTQLYRQYSTMIEVAKENEQKEVEVGSWREIIKKVVSSEKLLERNHQKLLSLKLR